MTTHSFREKAQYNWLKGLQAADPTSVLLKQEVAKIEDLHTDWEPSNQPPTAWAMWATNPQAGDEPNPNSLIGKPITEWASQLNNISWRTPRTMTPHLPLVQMTARNNHGWGIELATTMMTPQPKDVPAWEDIILAWNQSDLTESEEMSVLDIIAHPVIQAGHGQLVADHLFNLVKYGGKSYVLNLLDKAEAVAQNLWPHMNVDTPPQQNESWLEHSLNYSSTGYLPLFWANASAIRMHQQTNAGLSESCKRSFSMMLEDHSIRGFLAQSAIASHTAFLLNADERWTQTNVLPLFHKDMEQAAPA